MKQPNISFAQLIASRHGSGGAISINKMSSYQYRDPHVKDKTVSPTALSLTWESPYLGKMVFILRRGPGSLFLRPENTPPPCGVFYDCSGKEDGTYADEADNCQSYYTCKDGEFKGHNPCAEGRNCGDGRDACSFISHRGTRTISYHMKTAWHYCPFVWEIHR